MNRLLEDSLPLLIIITALLIPIFLFLDNKPEPVKVPVKPTYSWMLDVNQIDKTQELQCVKNFVSPKEMLERPHCILQSLIMEPDKPLAGYIEVKCASSPYNTYFFFNSSDSCVDFGKKLIKGE